MKPQLAFYWFDVAIALGTYALSLFLYVKRKRGYIQPLLLFGLFVFPLQFSIWFMWSDAEAVNSHPARLIEIIYLLFVKISVLFCVISAQSNQRR